jgi:GNAT superfamily N-acetyltransferase
VNSNQIAAGIEKIDRFKGFFGGLIDLRAPEIESLLEGIPEADLRRLMSSMETIEAILSGRDIPELQLKVRSHQPGDMGFVAYRHGILYEREDGFDTSFDGYVIEGLNQFVKQYDPEKDHLWVALRGDRPVGSIAIVNAGQDEAQLRWFLVEPEVRDLGVGRLLMETAMAFCVQKGYRIVFLWTLSHLEAARSLYERFGFSLTETKTHPIWGRTLTEERWERLF